MSNYKHCCVINEDGYYQTFVLVLMESQRDETVQSKVQGYKLRSVEKLIDAMPPIGVIKPRWTGTAWEERATEAEVAAWNKEHPKIEPGQTPYEKTALALAELAETQQSQDTETKLALAELAESNGGMK